MKSVVFSKIRCMRLLSLAIAACTAMAGAAQEVNLAPMLDTDVVVPNGGTFRFFGFGGFDKENVPHYAVPFRESPYKAHSALRYDRLNWFELEGAEGEWLFEKTVEPLFVRSLRERSRLFLGLACNCGSMSVVQKHQERALAVPVYVFERCAAEGRPFRPCDQYGPSWVPDYDSQFLFERHSALMRAFADWIEGNVTGSNVRRKDVLYGIEVRYAGYWGEGGMRREHYPKTDIFDRYVDVYVECFPDTLLCLGAHESLHLPTRAQVEKNPANPMIQRAMTHFGKLAAARNRRGRLGWFIDSWNWPNSQYDRNSNRVFRRPDGSLVGLSDFFFGEVYRASYITGEFGYLTWLSDPGLAPYGKLGTQIAERGVSGISLHNFTVKSRESLKKVKRVRGAHYLPGGLPISEEVYAASRPAVSSIGYRFVLGSPSVVRTSGGVRASFTLANIGASRMFHEYNKVHVIAKGAAGRVLEDRRLDLNLSSLAPAATPLKWDESRATRVEADLPADTEEVLVMIPDETGIEYPLCLSNFGRRDDGSYLLGRVPKHGEIRGP